MLKVILNRLQPQDEENIAEKQAGFRVGICYKYLQHQPNLYHAFIDFKKTFDGVWLGALWETMRNYNINANSIRVIKPAWQGPNAVLFNRSKLDWFWTTVGVRQQCLLPPNLFNICQETIMYEALDDHEGNASTGGRRT